MKNPLKQIIFRCKKNARDGQKELYEQFYAYAMSISLRYVGDENGAREVTNEAFFKFFTQVKNFDETQEFKPYFRRIVINTALDYMKKEEKQQTENIQGIQIPVSNTDVLSMLSYKELYDLVQTLSKSYRAVFNLYAIDGYKHREIAEILGISEGASKSNLHKARAILQDKVLSIMKTKV